VAHETQASITEWCEATFGPIISHARIAARANEEMAELIKALTSDDRHPKATEEIADVFIVLYRLASRLGVDLHGEINRKMAVNRAREWKLDGTGHGYHVPKPKETS
jgi:phosphoribosyl-ATP pyrophosphohydrolase